MIVLEVLVAVWIATLALTLLAFVIAYLIDLRRDPPAWWVRRRIEQIPEPDDPRWSAPSRRKERTS